MFLLNVQVTLVPQAFDPAAAAKLLADAMRSGSRLKELPESARPATIAHGYDIQESVARTADTFGWKLGLGSANAMRGAKLDRPLIGRMFKGRLYDNGAEVPAPAGAKALIEIEIAFTLGRDVAPTDKLANPLDAVANAHLVSEIVLSRFLDRTVVGLPSFTADSVGFHGLVVGADVETADIGALTRSLTVTLDGKPATSIATGDDAIDPITMLAVLITHARERGQTLRKGEIITTGTLSKPFDAPVPSTIEAKTDFGNVRYTLKAV